MMTQDSPEDPGADGEAATAAPLEGADLTIDVVTLEAFLDALRQASPSEGRVVPFPRKPFPRSE
jgi:hypothetical protein